MSDSNELRTIKKCSPELAIALTDVEPKLVHFLHDKGFITETLHDEILEPRSLLSEAEKASKLVKWIRKSVELDAPKYHILLELFKAGGPFYKSIVDILHTEYERGVSFEHMQQQHKGTRLAGELKKDKRQPTAQQGTELQEKAREMEGLMRELQALRADNLTKDEHIQSEKHQLQQELATQEELNRHQQVTIRTQVQELRLRETQQREELQSKDAEISRLREEGRKHPQPQEGTGQGAQVKQENDPYMQKQGLAAYLDAIGIECPQCHMHYDLARGGCLHFICTQCPNEFCSACSESFNDGKKCVRSCGTKGLHAHHPRDCLYWLRDFQMKQLQDFLQENGVEFDVELPQEQVKAAKMKLKDGVNGGKDGAWGEGENQSGDESDDGGEVTLQCSVTLQKEKPQGLKDEECGKDVINGHAGLCDVHYKEYLVDKINRNRLDPITIYDTHRIQIFLTRQDMVLPPREENDDGVEKEESEADLRERMIKHVQEVLPLMPHACQPATGPTCQTSSATCSTTYMQVKDLHGRRRGT